MKVLVLGAGKMVGALLKGLHNGGHDLSEWLIFSPSKDSARTLAKEIGASAIEDLSHLGPLEFILLGCKPQQLHDLKSLIGDQFNDQLFISLLAAVSEENQLKILGAKSLIRMMPNLPVEKNAGVTLLSSDSISMKLPSFKTLFSILGEVFIVNEDELDELTLLTGSGPALFYEFALTLSKSFSSLNETERERLSSMVLRGAGLSVEKDKTLLELIENVTSKGGVTKAILDSWRKGSFGDVISQGVIAGKKRTQEIKDSLQS
jgi:pyrroline-5-carboxylate reductase